MSDLVQQLTEEYRIAAHAEIESVIRCAMASRHEYPGAFRAAKTAGQAAERKFRQLCDAIAAKKAESS